jgi:hypothetical protein
VPDRDSAAAGRPADRRHAPGVAPHTTVVGVRFQPGAASLLLNLPADELVGLSVQLDELWGVTAIRLGELLAGAARKSRGSRPHKC